MSLAALATSQTITTPTGKTIPVTLTAGVDITLAPIDKAIKSPFIGWVQVKYTVYPVYQGSRGGLFVMRIPQKPNAEGLYTPYRFSVTDMEAKIVWEGAKPN